MSEHMQEEEEDPLQSVQDSEDPRKDNGTFVDYKQTKDPGQPKQWQQDDGGLHYAPNTNKTGFICVPCLLAMELT